MKLSYVGVLNFATVDAKGRPQVRCISAVHFDEESFWFLTARGKEFAQQLMADGHVQILVYTRFKEMIRVSAKAVRLPDERREACEAGCPQQAIKEGSPFVIHQDHCLQCGRCYENCPVQAIERVEA